MRIRTRFNGQTSKFPKRTLFKKNIIHKDLRYRSFTKIREFHPRSDFFPSWIPDPNSLHPGSRIHKKLKYFNHQNPKKWFLSSKKKDTGCSSWIRMLTFFFHPGSRGEKGTQSRIPDPDLLLGKSCNQVQFVYISTGLILTDVTNRLKNRL